MSHSSKHQWQNLLQNRRHLLLTVGGVLFLLLAFVLNFFVSSWVDTVATASVGDLFLDRIPIFKIDFLFFWAVFIFWMFILTYHLIYPKQFGYICWSLAVFTLVRCFFISLTHLGPPETAIEIPESLSWFNFHADMFFSGHVGAPFLVALIINNTLFRYLIFIYCACMVVIVLMAHGHYSIDIFASFFISHSLSVLLKKTEPYFYDVNYTRGPSTVRIRV